MLQSDREKVLEVLKRGMETFPELRVCQLIGNATQLKDNYYVSDELLIKYVEKLIAEHGGSNA